MRLSINSTDFITLDGGHIDWIIWRLQLNFSVTALKTSDGWYVRKIFIDQVRNVLWEATNQFSTDNVNERSTGKVYFSAGHKFYNLSQMVIIQVRLRHSMTHSWFGGTLHAVSHLLRNWCEAHWCTFVLTGGRRVSSTVFWWKTSTREVVSVENMLAWQKPSGMKLKQLWRYPQVLMFISKDMLENIFVIFTIMMLSILRYKDGICCLRIDNQSTR